ncbi:MAG: STAS domain-containing protein [Candidatus Tumulicola sp.]
MRENPNIAVIALRGELDIARKEELRAALSVDGADGVLLDMSGVDYADSTALTELLRFRLVAKERDLPVAVVIATPQLDRIVRYAGLYEVFDVFSNRDDARRHLEEAA